MNEANVIGQVLRGDVGAYDLLVRKYAAVLTGAARHLICNTNDAEDLAQETLLEAYRNLPSLRNHQAYRAWVFGILRFKCIDYLRQRKPEALGLDEYAEVIPAPTQEDTGDLMELLNALPLQDREVLAARYIQDLDYKDIAEALGITEEAARMRCSRARSRIRAINEKRMRQAMGIFLAPPLTPGFTNRVIQHTKQIQVTPTAAPATGGSLLLAGGSLKTAIWLGGSVIAVGVLLFFLLRPVAMHPNAPAKALQNSQNQTSYQRRGPMDPDVVTKNEMILVGCTSDGSDIHGLWIKFMEKEKDIKNRVEGTSYEWHAWAERKCMVAAEVTEVSDIPEGTCVMRLPAGQQYAIFTHRLANGGYEGLNSVMHNWLTTGPYEQISDISIQVFDARFKGGDQPDSEIDFWIPVKPRE